MILTLKPTPDTTLLAVEVPDDAMIGDIKKMAELFLMEIIEMNPHI